MVQPDARPATPDQALTYLLDGNRRFVTGTRIHPNQDAEHRAALADEQRPFAVMFGCSDSRLAAEMIFDRGLGDLFVVRTAGHTVGPEVLGSIEYGVAVLGTPLVVVLGHDSCGAVAAARDALNGTTPGGHLRAVIDGVAPSVRLAAARGIDDLAGIGDVHVRRTADVLLGHCAALAAAVAAGTCAVVGLSYQLAAGKVNVLCQQPVLRRSPERRAA